MRYLAAFAFTAIALSAQPCPTTCPTADDIAVEALLSAGGHVQLEGRTYTTCQPMRLRSNTTLRGAGRGVTVIVGSTVITPLVVDGVSFRTTIAAVAADNVRVSDLTVDNFTCSRDAHGVAFYPDGADLNGTNTTNGVVERVEVLGAPGLHRYMIWNLKGHHIKFLNNWVDGKSFSASTGGENQEGLESFGGRDVVMSGNTVKNIGMACITLGAGNVEDSDTEGLRIVNNHLSNCTVGINLTAFGVFNGESVAATLISGNQIRNSRRYGIDVPLDFGAFVRALNITDNTIIGVSESLGAGIQLRSNGTTQIIPSANVIGTLVANNHVEGVTGANSFGIYVSNFPSARILSNTVIGTIGSGSDAIRSYNSSDIEISGNKIERANGSAISVYRTGSLASARVMVESNRVSDWKSTASGIFVQSATYGTMLNNVFGRSDTATPSPIYFLSSCGFTISGNVPWYLPSYAQLTTSACP